MVFNTKTLFSLDVRARILCIGMNNLKKKTAGTRTITTPRTLAPPQPNPGSGLEPCRLSLYDEPGLRVSRI